MFETFISRIVTKRITYTLTRTEMITKAFMLSGSFVLFFPLPKDVKVGSFVVDTVWSKYAPMAKFIHLG